MKWVSRVLAGLVLFLLYGVTQSPVEPVYVTTPAGILAALLLYWVFFRRPQTRVVLTKSDEPNLEPSSANRVKKHRRGVAGVAGVMGALLVVSMAFLWFTVGDNPEVTQAIPALGRFGQAAGIIIGLASLATAFGVKREETWGRHLGRIVAFVYAWTFPLGTMIGAYLWWYLESPEVKEAMHG